jgi:hypothetical protein
MKWLKGIKMNKSEWYDLDGKPCDGWRYNEIIGGKERFLVCTHVGKSKVSTIWLGKPHSGEGILNIFETMVFDGTYEIDPVRYDTKEQALKGHEIIVNKLKKRRQ